MPVNHSTRSVNCLLRSPIDHNVNNNTSQWGGAAGIQQTFTAAGAWGGGQFGSPTFTPDTNASFEIDFSSLKTRHGQARVMAWASLTYQGNSTTYDKYDYDYAYTRSNLPNIVYGLPTYVYPNSNTTYAGTTNNTPCEMSTFSANGRTNQWATVNTNTSFPVSGFRQIIMDAPSGLNNPNPISMGPSAGV